MLIDTGFCSCYPKRPFLGRSTLFRVPIYAIAYPLLDPGDAPLCLPRNVQDLLTVYVG